MRSRFLISLCDCAFRFGLDASSLGFEALVSIFVGF